MPLAQLRYRPLADIRQLSHTALLAKDQAVSILDDMTPQEVYDWEWNALPRWAKAISLVVGGPAFAVLTWSILDPDALSGTAQAICFVLITGVALVQIYCLNKIVRSSRLRD